MVKKKMSSGGSISNSKSNTAKGYKAGGCVKMAAGGAMKSRRDFPMTKKEPAKKGK